MLTWRHTLRSIAELHRGTEIIGAGNLDYALPVNRGDEIGELARAFNRMTANLKDVTASKAELEREIAGRQRAEEALRASEARYRSLFENINVGFAQHEIICDERGAPVDYRFIEINSAFERLTGLKGTDVIGRTVREVLPTIEDFWIETYGRVALTGESAHFENYAAPLQQHYEVFAYCTAPRQFAVLFMNVTERKRVQERINQLNAILTVQMQELQNANVQLEEQAEELRAANEQLQQHAQELQIANVNLQMAYTREQMARADVEASNDKLMQIEQEIRKLNDDLQQRAVELESANRELESFSYSISHDLRTPLASIFTFASILLNDYGEQLPPEAVNFTKLILENSKSTNQLIEALLKFARSARQPVQKQPVDLALLARQAMDELQAQRRDRRVEFVVGDLPVCQADPLLFKQVLINLLSNALKFTRTREVARIEVGYGQRAVDDGQHSPSIVYHVRDNGVGFDMAQAEKLFGVFQRLHHEDEYPGTGVGLAIVERIIHRHGGRIWAEGEVGKGATFYFTLPE